MKIDWQIEHQFEDKAQVKTIIRHSAELCYQCAFCKHIEQEAKNVIPKRILEI